MRFLQIVIIFTFIFITNIQASERIGIYIGTFDPPHSGHIKIVNIAIEEAQLDKVIVIPNFDAPHKPNATSVDLRFRMTQLTFRNLPNIDVVTPQLFSLLTELNNNGSTDDVYKYLVEQSLPDNLLFQISGSDIINRYKDRVSAIKINHPRLKLLLTNRPEEDPMDEEFVASYKHIIHLLRTPSSEVSSTYLRKQIASNQRLEHLTEFLHPEVLDFIIDNKLYLPKSECEKPLLE